MTIAVDLGRKAAKKKPTNKTMLPGLFEQNNDVALTYNVYKYHFYPPIKILQNIFITDAKLVLSSI